MEKIVGFAAALIVITGQVIYILNCLQRKITPSVLTWFGWAVLMCITLISQIIHGGWQWSMTAIAFSTVGCLVVTSDALLGAPTIVKAWREPAQERSVSWVLSMTSAVLALLICIGHEIIYFLFPAYLLLYNGTMVQMTWMRRQR